MTDRIQFMNKLLILVLFRRKDYFCGNGADPSVPVKICNKQSDLPAG